MLPVVQELKKQCENCRIEFEIIAQDDASKSEFNVENEKINQLSNCRFIALEKNVGYRENKNIMVEMSKFDNLIILDGDCIILNSNYIQNYINQIPFYDGVYGGRIHNKTCPSGNQKLRWKYGFFIEDKDSEERLKNPHSSFLFNNTLIKKKCFNAVKFDSSFKKYGHDDTQFSFQLMKKKYKLHHIENPIEHNDIDSNIIYYDKTKGSIENLLVLYKSKKIDSKYMKMTRIFSQIEKLKLNFILSYGYQLIEKRIEKNLISDNPSLLVFNLFRLGYLCKISSKNPTV